jgi:phage-related minor tail protein
MDKFAIQANKAAKALGQQTTAYTNAALIYYQQGLQSADADALAATTLKVGNITGQDTKAVSEEITAVMNGYQLGAEQV